MKLIHITFIGFSIWIAQPLLAQTLSAVANFQVIGPIPAIFSFYKEPSKYVENYPIFDSFTLTSGNLSHIFTVTQANDPDFEPLAALLTDGVNERVGYTMQQLDGAEYSSINFESNFFENLPSSNPNGFGLAGYQIDSISAVFNDTGPIDLGGNIVESYGAQLSVNYEPAPEPPTTVLLTLLGSIFAILVHNLRQRQVRMAMPPNKSLQATAAAPASCD